MSDSEEDAFQSADEGETAAKSGDGSPSAASAPKTEPTKTSQSKKKDRKRGKRNKKGGNKSQSSTDATETPAPKAEKEVEVNEKVEDLKVEDEATPEKASDIPSDSALKRQASGEDTREQKPEEVTEKAQPVKDSTSIEPENASTVVDEAKGDTGKSEVKEVTTKTEPPTEPSKEKSSVGEEEAEGNEEKVAETEKPKEVSAAFDRLTEPDSSGGGWGWGGGWGTSLLSTATSSVSSFTNSIGEGIKTAVETVESGLGVPDPEELARIQQERRKEREAEREAERLQRQEVPPQDIERDSKEEEREEEKVEAVKDEEKKGEEQEEESADGGGGWLAGWGVSQLSSVVHKTAEVVTKVQDSSKTLVTGSLDVLETLGKKTYEVVAEGEHGVKKLSAAQKSNLSLLLREAAEEAEQKAKQEEQFVEARKSHFGAQFDDNQGLVQLEALEMLSNECEAHVHNLLSSLSSSTFPQSKALLIAIKEAFDIEDLDDEADEEQDFVGLMKETTGELGLNVTANRILAVKSQALEWLEEEGVEGKSNAAAIHQKAIQVLARLTAVAVGHFHRVGQLCLSDESSQPSMLKARAVSLANTTRYLGLEVGNVSAKFNHCLSTCATDKDDSETVNPLMTNIYLEATNSSSYIQDAFQLLLPVLQQAALQAHKHTDG